MVRGLNHAFIARSLAAVRDVFIMAFIESSKAPIGALYIDASHGCEVDVARAGAGYCTGTYLLFRSGKVQYCTGKKTPGGAGTHTGHTRDTRAPLTLGRRRRSLSKEDADLSGPPRKRCTAEDQEPRSTGGNEARISTGRLPSVPRPGRRSPSVCTSLLSGHRARQPLPHTPYEQETPWC